VILTNCAITSMPKQCTLCDWPRNYMRDPSDHGARWRSYRSTGCELSLKQFQCISRSSLTSPIFRNVFHSGSKSGTRMNRSQ